MDSAANKAISAVYQGKLVECTKEEYPEVRDRLQDQAGKWIDSGQDVRAMIAIEEVKRLDKANGFHLPGTP